MFLPSRRDSAAQFVPQDPSRGFSTFLAAGFSFLLLICEKEKNIVDTKLGAA